MSHYTESQDIYREVTLSLASENSYYIPGIVEALTQKFDLLGDNPTITFDDIDPDIYWGIVENHEISKLSTKIGSFESFANNILPGHTITLDQLDEIELLDYIDTVNTPLQKEGIYLSTDKSFYSINEIPDHYAALIRSAIINAERETS